MEKNYSISVIVPFFNEENYLEESVNRLIEVGVFKEIILVDNKSTDKSNFIANSFVRSHKNIFLIKAFEKSGKGYAVSVGLKYATSTHLIIHDADLEYSPKDIKKLFNVSKNEPSCLILGSRTQTNLKRKKIYKTLVLINKFYSIIFSILNNYKVSDIATCYMLLPSNFFIKNINKEKGFGIEVEILSSFLQTNNEIIEFPISYIGRKYSEGKKIKLKDGINIFVKIIKYSKFVLFFKIR